MRDSARREDLQARTSPGELTAIHCISLSSLVLMQRACPTTQVASAIVAGLPFDGVLINYTRAGIPFTNHLTLEPLCLGPASPGRITHYVGTLRASPCCEAPSHEPNAHAVEARQELRMDVGMDAPAAIQNGACDVGSQSLACRHLATELLATNGYAPVSLPQLVRPGSLTACAASCLPHPPTHSTMHTAPA